MVGELVQGAISEFRDDNDASDPLATVGRFVGAGIAVGAWGEMLEVAGDIGGVMGGILPDQTPQPAVTPQVTAQIDPAFASGPAFGKPFA